MRTYFYHASGCSFIDPHNFTTAAKWYTFEMENSGDKARYCHETTVQSCIVETFSISVNRAGAFMWAPVNQDPGINPFTPKSDQFQISPVATPEI